MSRTIDERVVQMTFNNQDFERNAKQTINTLGKLKDATDDTVVGNFSNSLSAIGASARKLDLRSITAAFQSITDSVGIFETMAIGALIRIGERATDTGIRLAKSLSVDQIASGWQKYAAAIQSEQTIMSAVAGKMSEITGEIFNIDSITERISKLQWYTDETSYNISQMTNAIGSFTSAGIDLDVATQAIMGIANACADAGVDTQKAEHAFLGFSKAIASENMTLSIWNNQLKTSGLTNSERFKQSLLDAGVAAGTLTKKLDATGKAIYTTTKLSKKAGESFDLAGITESFTDTGWANRKVMLDALNSYSDTVDRIYEMTQSGEFDTASEAIAALTEEYKKAGKEVPKSLAAFTRAQEAISFEQAIQSAKDAVSSKWSQTFELIFGNYEEAKTLWTTLANEMWEWFASSGDKRNELLKQWHEGLSEFQQLFDGVDDDTKWTNQLVKKYSDAIDELLLSTPSNKLKSDPSKLKQLEKEKKVFEDFFAAIDENNGEKVVSIWKDNSDLLIDNLQELPDKLVELQKEFDNLNAKDLLTNQIKQLEDELGSGKLNAAAKKQKQALLDTYKGLSEAIAQGDKSSLQHYWKDNFKSLSKVYKSTDNYKDIISEINKISKDTTLKEYEKEKLLNRQYMKLAEMSLEYSNIDEMAKIEAEIDKEILGYFIDKKSGYEIFISAIQKGLENITTIITTIRKSFSEVFPSITPKGLIDLTQSFSNFMDRITLSEESLEKVASFFERVFKILKNVLSVIEPVYSILKAIWNTLIIPLSIRLKPIFEDVLEIFENIGVAISNTSKSVSDNMGPVRKFFADIMVTIEPLIRTIHNLVKWIKELTAAWAKGKDDIEGANTNTVNNNIFSQLLKIIQKAFEILEKIVTGSKPLITFIKDTLSGAITFLGDTLKNVFATLNDVIGDNNFNAVGFFGIIAAIQQIFGVKWGVEGFKTKFKLFEFIANAFDNLKTGLSAIPNFINELSGQLYNISDAIGAFWNQAFTESLKNIGYGMLAISAAVLILASIKEDALNRAIVAIGMIGVVLGALLKLVDTLQNRQFANMSGKTGILGMFTNITSIFTVISTTGIAIQLFAIASAMVAISLALKLVSTIPVESMGQSLFMLLAMMAALYAFVAGISKLEKRTVSVKKWRSSISSESGVALKNIGKIVEQMAFGLLIIAGALKLVSTIPVDVMGQTIFMLTWMLAAIGIFIGALSKIDISKKSYNPLKSIGKAFEQVALGLVIVSAALKIVSTIGDPAAIVGSIAALSFMLLAMGVFMSSMAKIENGLSQGKSLLKVASSILVLSIAIGAVVGSLAVMCAIPVDALAKGVTFLAIAFAEIFAFSKAMAGVGKGSGDLLAISASLVLFSAAIGVMALALAAIGTINTDSLTQAVLSIAVLMTLIGSIAYIFSSGAVLKGILAFSAAFLAIGASVMMVGIGISQLVPLLMLLSTQSADIAAGISETLIAVFQTMLSVVPSFIIALVNAILQFVGLLIQGIADNLPVLLDGFLNLLITLCNALGEIAKQRGGELGVALGNLASGLIIGLWEALKGALGSLASGLISWITGGSDLDKVGEEISKKMGMSGDNDLLGGFVESIETQAPELSSAIDSAMSPVGSAGGDSLSDSMIETMETRSPEVQKAAENLASDAAEEMDASSEASAASKSTVDGYVSFLQSGTASGLVSAAFSGLGYVGINALKQALGIKSPSRVMAEQGMYSVLGLVEGVYDNLNYVDEAGVDTANTLLNAMQLAAENANSILEDDLNPVITPVLDMSNIEGEAGQISSLLGNNSSYNAALSVSQANSLRGIQNGLQSPFAINVNFTINEAGGELTEADFIKFGNEIASIVNEKLGGLV